MLRSLRELYGYRIRATDDELGKVKDILIDDNAWMVRYLVADTGTWLPERKVLIPMAELKSPDWEKGHFPVSLSKDQVEKAPPLSVDEPVSRQHEAQMHTFFGWQPYWIGGLPSGAFPGQVEKGEEVEADLDEKPASAREDEDSDPHLRSTDEVIGYDISATDGKIGHVEDFIADDNGWAVRYFVVDTRDWLPGKKVILSPDWVSEVSWEESAVKVDMDKEQIKNAPEYNPSAPVNRDYEGKLYDYYGREKYWAEKKES